jgi:predicted amidophosphoribosyltransferase
VLAAAGSFLLDLLWPQKCMACAALVVPPAAFCPVCDVSVLPVPAACPGCAMPLADAGGACPGCRERPQPFRQVRAALIYGGSVAQALVRLKHGNKPSGARPLARFVAPLLRWAQDEGAEAVLPVPLHPRRLRQRGFNQVVELLREASALPTPAPDSVPLPLWVDTLVRVTDTAPLGHEPPSVRRARVAGAFRVPRPARVRGRRLLLVDDVMTTGATLAESSRALLAAGAADVLVAALARAL